MAITRKEAVTAYFNFEIPDNLVEKVCLDRGISFNAEYSADNQEDIELAVADLCLSLINHQSESEGGYSVTFDNKKLMDLRAVILRKYGETDQQIGTINAKSVW